MKVKIEFELDTKLFSGLEELAEELVKECKLNGYEGWNTEKCIKTAAECGIVPHIKQTLTIMIEQEQNRRSK